ncbi:hypothetical protein [Chitinimonas prasina]|nr:hypothetical protein [Chitinimonas prasina]
MKVIVYTLRNQGRKLAESAWRNNPTKPGTMSLSSTTYGERRVELLTFYETQPNQVVAGKNGLAMALYEPRLITLGSGRMRFAGFESVGTGQEARGVVQEWITEVVP